MQKLKINDELIVITGKDKKKKGKLLKILGNGRLIVENVNMVKKAIKPTQENPDVRIIDKEASIDPSNVALVDPKTGKGTRVQIQTIDNKKVRVTTASGTVLN